MNNQNPYSVVYLMGGFGNQLFQLCFANDLKKRGHIVSIDTTNYSSPDDGEISKREIIIPIKDFEFESEPNKVFNFYSNLSRYRKNSFKNYKVFPFKKFNDINYLKEKEGKYNFYVGYWQDTNLITENKDFLIKNLSKNKTIKEGLISKPNINETLLHIRREDYLIMKEELKIDYYEKAIREASKKIPEFEYNIFTDDINWIKKHKLFNSAKNVFYSSNSRIDTIKTFSEMLKHNNFIISNSTFSLIPAILKENETSKIISPFPWYRNSNKELNLKQNWIKLGNNE